MNAIARKETYDRGIQHFISVSRSLDFELINRDFLEFLPTSPGKILDVGSGAGQNAAALARLNHEITAVEPMFEFLEAARDIYSGLNINWINDSLPSLDWAGSDGEQFDFILLDSVWHHLNESEQHEALKRLASLTKVGGKCAFSLRNGPSIGNIKIHPIDVEGTIESAKEFGLNCIFRFGSSSHSQCINDVNWTRIVLQKI